MRCAYHITACDMLWEQGCFGRLIVVGIVKLTVLLRHGGKAVDDGWLDVLGHVSLTR